MLISVWSPKGGSGTSVISAALSIELGRSHVVRLVDLGGDQPAIFGLAADPEDGVGELLASGPGIMATSLTELTVPTMGHVRLLPRGRSAVADLPPERGAELALLLREEPTITIVDVGSPESAVARACIELADVALIVLRGCYLALRRAVHSASLSCTHAAIAVTHPERPLRSREISDVLQVPVIASVEEHPDIARAVDAGVLANRCPVGLSRAMEHVVHHLHLPGWGQVA